MSEEPVKYLLSERDIPAQWLNLLVDLPGEPLPPLHPRHAAARGTADLTPLFPIGLIEQEVSSEPFVAIPEEVLAAYKLWRPTPLYRARRLERELDTPAHIYYNYEGVSPAGSHKPKHRGATGLRERARGCESPRHRDRRGAVGLLARIRVLAVRPRV